ncbi:hypothetical protein [Aquimarina sp. SS2-1]|uniref:hypothetical protein n=1 Tax=Aquimarina besae TaxID=3342247 RepID=UPI00366E0678
MNKVSNNPHHFIIFGIPTLIIGAMILISKSSVFLSNPNGLSVGITVDLLLTVPLIYFLLIRKTRIPKTTVIPLMVIGFLVCTLIIPAQNQYYLELFKTWVLPVIELSVISYVIYNVRNAIKRYNTYKNESVDFFTTLKTTCNEILPKPLVAPVVTEIAVFYYGFIYWKKRKLKENEFSYHKDSGTVALLIAIIFIIAIETVVLHMLLAKWSTVTAWILTFLSIYSGIQLFGFLKSMYKRPISITNDQLILRYGMMGETIITIANIDSIDVSSSEIELNKETRKLSFLGELESHNVIIRLKKKNTLTGLYGIKRNYKNLVFYIDKKDAFKDSINNHLQQYK